MDVRSLIFLKNTMKNKLFFIITILIAGAVAFMVTNKGPGLSEPQGPRKVRVVTTLFPLYDFARNIGRDKAEVVLLLPPGVEAHSFEPKPSDLIKVNEADIFVYTGRFMEPWAQDIIRGVAGKRPLIVDASKGTRMIRSDLHHEDEPAGSLDPHIWLDFDNAKVMVKSICQALEAMDADNSEYYRQNAHAYGVMLTELDDAFRSALRDCERKEIVYGGHYAFGYMAHRYGLKYMTAQGVSPDAEPSAKDLSRLVEQIRIDKIRYVFYEELTSPKIAQTIARETDAGMLMLSAAQNVTRDQYERGTSFIEIMKEDLDNLKTGLGCAQ